jgi:hypothetical protein
MGRRQAEQGGVGRRGWKVPVAVWVAVGGGVLLLLLPVGVVTGGEVKGEEKRGGGGW